MRGKEAKSETKKSWKGREIPKPMRVQTALVNLGVECAHTFFTLQTDKHSLMWSPSPACLFVSISFHCLIHFLCLFLHSVQFSLFPPPPVLSSCSALFAVQKKAWATHTLLSLSLTQTCTHMHKASYVWCLKWKEGAGRKDSQLLHMSSGVHRGNSLAAEHPDYQTQLPIISCLVCEPHYLSCCVTQCVKSMLTLILVLLCPQYVNLCSIEEIDL